MDAAYVELGPGAFRATRLTVGPWNPEHQHAGPPSALIARAVERAALSEGLAHLARLTVALLRPAPIGECRVEVAADYAGRNAAHYSGRFLAKGKEAARFTALVQREEDLPVPGRNPDPPAAPKPPGQCRLETMNFPDGSFGYADLVETRVATGHMFKGPCAAWFRMNHPLVKGEQPSPYERVAVAADSGSGIGAALDFFKYSFANCDLTINLFRRPEGEWIGLDSRSLIGAAGCGMAESALYDEQGMIGRATQSLAIRRR